MGGKILIEFRGDRYEIPIRDDENYKLKTSLNKFDFINPRFIKAATKIINNEATVANIEDIINVYKIYEECKCNVSFYISSINYFASQNINCIVENQDKITPVVFHSMTYMFHPTQLFLFYEYLEHNGFNIKRFMDEQMLSIFCLGMNIHSAIEWEYAEKILSYYPDNSHLMFLFFFVEAHVKNKIRSIDCSRVSLVYKGGVTHYPAVKQILFGNVIGHFLEKILIHLKINTDDAKKRLALIGDDNTCILIKQTIMYYFLYHDDFYEIFDVCNTKKSLRLIECYTINMLFLQKKYDKIKYLFKKRYFKNTDDVVAIHIMCSDNPRELYDFLKFHQKPMVFITDPFYDIYFNKTKTELSLDYIIYGMEFYYSPIKNIYVQSIKNLGWNVQPSDYKRFIIMIETISFHGLIDFDRKNRFIDICVNEKILNPTIKILYEIVTNEKEYNKVNYYYIESFDDFYDITMYAIDNDKKLLTQIANYYGVKTIDDDKDFKLFHTLRRILDKKELLNFYEGLAKTKYYDSECLSRARLINGIPQIVSVSSDVKYLTSTKDFDYIVFVFEHAEKKYINEFMNTKMPPSIRKTLREKIEKND